MPDSFGLVMYPVHQPSSFLVMLMRSPTSMLSSVSSWALYLNFAEATQSTPGGSEPPGPTACPCEGGLPRPRIGMPRPRMGTPPRPRMPPRGAPRPTMPRGTPRCCPVPRIPGTPGPFGPNAATGMPIIGTPPRGGPAGDGFPGGGREAVGGGPELVGGKGPEPDDGDELVGDEDGGGVLLSPAVDFLRPANRLSAYFFRLPERPEDAVPVGATGGGASGRLSDIELL
mmetsp:Transcript_37431/g.94034  ORF Transcript_37431/g.94034 Transcript_37431/m.94034 type:complete len:228 (+) Transcript_37431:421-1104(+)